MSALLTLQNQAFGGNQSLDAAGVSFNWPLFQAAPFPPPCANRGLCTDRRKLFNDTAQRDTERSDACSLSRGGHRDLTDRCGQSTPLSPRVSRSKPASATLSSAPAACSISQRPEQLLRGTTYLQSDAIRLPDALLTLKQQAGRLLGGIWK